MDYYYIALYYYYIVLLQKKNYHYYHYYNYNVIDPRPGVSGMELCRWGGSVSAGGGE